MTPLLAAAAALLLEQAAAQFGESGGGGYNPPAPICPQFKCPAGQKAVGKEEHQIWSYGCKESGMNVFSAADLDPNDPFAGMNRGKKNLDKCCVERDICKQTCGMTSKACHDSFQKCTGKICKGDQNCQLQAMMADITSEPYDPDEYKKDYKYDPEESKCKSYKRGQAEACTCVPKNDFRSATESKLKSFYGKFNAEKLDASGEIKDVEEVWKKWKGKEPDMFLALATKYKAKAVETRIKPKPPPYKPPSDADTDVSDEGHREDSGSPDASSEPEGSGVSESSSARPAPAPDLDAEDDAFEVKFRELQAKKKQAAADEDYDLADKAKEETLELKAEELRRLKAKKAKAIEEEDYVAAKSVKTRLTKVEEL